MQLVNTQEATIVIACASGIHNQKPTTHNRHGLGRRVEGSGGSFLYQNQSGKGMLGLFLRPERKQREREGRSSV